MPTYLYKREDNSTFEIEQRITEPALTMCPTTGKSVQRLISKGTGLVFKGSGFYQTDYVRSATNGDTSSDPSTSEEKATSEKKSDSKSGSTSTTDAGSTGGSDSGSGKSASDSKNTEK